MWTIGSREELYNVFDRYTLQRKEELNRRGLEPGSGLLKAYLMETAANGQGVGELFGQIGWRLHPIDSVLYQIGGLPQDMAGFVDMLTSRYAVVYTTAKSQLSDMVIKRAVRESTSLDHIWLSAPLLNLIWQKLVEPTTRHAVLRYESEPLFGKKENVWDEEESEEEKAAAKREAGVARLEVKQSVRWLRERFAKNRQVTELFGHLTRVRVPAVARGRYEYFHYGKVTDRGNEFRGFALDLRFFVTQIYGAATKLIEERVSFSFDSHSIPNGARRLTMRGAPVTFTFPEPLRPEIFERFIDLTFTKGQGPFKLWGNPIHLSGPKVHVYGLDLHLWQQIYLDMTPKRFIVILPKGTSGNVIHRLTTNIQRFLDPTVEVYVGSERYEELIQRALREI